MKYLTDPGENYDPLAFIESEEGDFTYLGPEERESCRDLYRKLPIELRHWDYQREKVSLVIND